MEEPYLPRNLAMHVLARLIPISASEREEPYLPRNLAMHVLARLIPISASERVGSCRRYKLEAVLNWFLIFFCSLWKRSVPYSLRALTRSSFFV